MRRQAQFGDDDAALTLDKPTRSKSGPSELHAGGALDLPRRRAGECRGRIQPRTALSYGDGTKASASKARKWLQKAARQGNQEATTALKEGI